MARTDTLGHFLTDVADAIRTKTGSSETIIASDFDTEIENIPSGGSSHDWSAIGYNGEPKSLQEMFDYSKEIYDNWDNTIIDLNYKFNGDKKLIWFPLVDTSNVTNMSSMFLNCTSLTEIPQFDTSNVTNMTDMFYNCTALEEIPQLNTSNVTNMSSMFYNCTSLKEIPQLNTSNVTNMTSMFKNCTSLKEIPQLNTSNVTNMTDMFYNCTALEEIPQLNTSNVTNMTSMFKNCTNLTTVPALDTSSINRSTGFNNMFSGTTKLTDESLNNILTMCINATSYNGTKTLAVMGFQSRNYSASRIEALSNYQSFINAGWTIGY